MRKIVLALAGAAALALLPGTVSTPAHAAGGEIKMMSEKWSFDGIFGTFDRAALQRGFQVYKEVCSACHGVKLLYFRNLEDLGFSEEEVKAIASGYEVTDGPNDEGEMFKRKARPSDHFPRPFANDQAARAAMNGALPPDLSLITKAREGGPDYIFSLMNGYVDAPADVKMGDGMYYNKYFTGHQIAMPAPLGEGAVTFADNTPASVKQMAHDVVTFLTWAAEPNLEERKRTGFKVIFFLLIATGLLYAVKRKVWADVH